MKKWILWLLLFCFSSFQARAAADSVLYIDQMPPNGLWLGQWKQMTGDNPVYASPGFNDARWATIIPSSAAVTLPGVARSKTGWLRLKFRLAPQLKNVAIYLGTPTVAVEVYLNGQLCARRGTIDTVLKTGHAYNGIDPISLPVSDTGVQVLAIRYVHDPFFYHFNQYGQPAVATVFFCSLPNIAYRIVRDRLTTLTSAICAGILLLLTVFHAVLYRFDRAVRANLYFAAFTCCFTVAYLTSLLTYFPAGGKTALFINVLYTYSGLTYYFQLKALNTLFTLNYRWIGSWIAWLMIISYTVFLFADIPVLYSLLPLLLVAGVTPFLVIKAVLHKKPGARFIAPGYLVAFVSAIVFFYYVVFGSPFGPDVYWYDVSIACMTLGVSLSTSFYLSHNFGQKSRLLAQKLAEVEQLSTANLRKEQEKQQLLANQNELLESQVTQRTAALHETLEHLQQTQAQLIQSAKMASLGELVAGVAHEIQNPLNFVNNFAEVNEEMLQEMEGFLQAGETQQALDMAGDIRANEAKVRHHGKRANHIVKSMLEHTRAGTGKKEPLQINKLVEEYLRLAYHGMRAKDHALTVELVTQLAADLPLLPANGQDLGRVLLNVFNNALYAVRQKQLHTAPHYHPLIEVRTLCSGEVVEINVLDNGTGIPAAIRDKIMQPFFTTKPTGEGIGLGLSLAYDIIVKGYGGSIEAITAKDGRTEFIITIPLKFY